MISMLICSPEEKELRYFASVMKELAASESDERWEFRYCHSADEMTLAADSGDIFDMICIDADVPEMLTAAGRLKALNPDAHIIIVARKNVSPASYILPAVFGMGLIMRPLGAQEVEEGLRENVRAYVRKMSGAGTGNSFVLDSKEGRMLIPYNSIAYFESREKKIFLYTSKNEYSFYDTLDRLEKDLPAGQFIRCHRSFIVSRDKISSIAAAKNLIILDNGEMVPLSRTYKAELKSMAAER